MQKYFQGVFHLPYVELKHQSSNITKLVQTIFNTWLGYFEYVDYLPCRITLIVLN